MNVTRETHLFARIRFFSWLLIGVWTGCIGGSLAWNLRQQAEHSLQMARHTAQVTFENDVLYRRWAAEQGGVYVRVSEEIRPNPYLQVPERDVTTTSGLSLTLVNPAYMARQVNALAGDTAGSQAHLTSLKPTRPENAPDAWETAALRSFEAGAAEVSSVEEMADGEYLRLMRPSILEPGCLKCHAAQGDKEGEIRGGVSVSVPMAPLRAIERPMTARFALAHLGLWAIGLAGIGVFRRSLGREILARERAEIDRGKFVSLAERSTEFIGMCDMNFRPFYVNEAGRRLVGLDSLEQACDTPVNEFFFPEDQRFVSEEFFPRVLRDGQAETEIRFRHFKTGEPLWMIYHVFYLQDGNGKPVGLATVSRDITERKRAEDALRRLSQFPEENPNPVLRVTGAGALLYANGPARGWLEGLGWEADDPLPACVRAVVADARRQEDGVETEIRNPAGSTFWISAVRPPDEDYVNLYCRNITERKQAEEAFRASREDLDRAQAVAHCGSWRLNVQRNELLWSDETWRIFGVPKGTPLSYETFLSTVHPDDRDYVHKQWSAGLRGDPYDVEHRIVVGGRIKWVREKAELEFDPQGRLLGGFGTTQDITERKHSEEALVAAKAAAEAANVAKSRFLANMSHELRTPMNAILGMIDVALPKATDPIVKDCLQTAKGSADLLLTLLDDLLDSAKIESGKLELESAPFSLRRMLDQVTRILAVRASEKGLSFCCRIPDETPDAVVGDRTRLQQVLLNLAGNAVKFTERGEVEIGLRVSSPRGEPCLEFAVRDTGVGIPSSAREQLFKPFAQADVSTSRHFGGTGLGLSICKSLVELMGGTIWFESHAGEGTTFYFTVRLQLATEVPSEPEAPAVVPTAVSRLSILLAEDNPANQKLTTYILQDRGHAVAIAQNGQEAIRLSGQNRYDAILMDVQMPGMDGLEATAAIRERERAGSRVPIIAMTAHAMRGDRERCLRAGMDGYLSKPVNAQEMIGLIESLACGASPVPPPSEATRSSAETPPQAAAAVFNPEEAISRCYNSRRMVQKMIGHFLGEVEALFAQMRAALDNGDLLEVGRLGHRLKGTAVYLGAQRVQEAALRVERFLTSHDGTPSEAEDAIDLLEKECEALKAVLSTHPLATENTRSD